MLYSKIQGLKQLYNVHGTDPTRYERMAEQDYIDFTWVHANHGGQHDWPFAMALQKGFFLNEGINLQIQIVPGGDALAQAVSRTLPIWNTAGLIDMTGLEVAVETMYTLGAIPQKPSPEALVDLCGLPENELT